MSLLNLFNLRRCGAEFLVCSTAGVVIKIRHCTKPKGHQQQGDRLCSDGESVWLNTLDPSKRWV